MDNNSMRFVKNLKLGWNLGNTLDAIGGDGLTSETAWGNPATTKEMIDAVRDAGFNVLRVPTTWYNHMDKDCAVDPAWMERVARIAGWGLDSGMYVILNLHHENWHAPTYANADRAESILTSLWAQIAERFGDRGQSLIFEAMNEPRLHGSPEEWSGGTAEGRDVINRLNAAFVRTVRSAGGHNASRHLMVPVYAASADPKAWEGFEVPQDDNISVSIHSYSPYDYALNVKGGNEWDENDGKDTGVLDGLFDSIAARFIEKGYPVIMGEFGAMNKRNTPSRARWAEYYTRKAAEKGIPCVWWDNGSFEGEGELFGLLDRRGLSWPYPEIVEALERGAGI